MVKLSWEAFRKDFDFNSITEVYFWKSEWENFDPHDHRAPVSVYYIAYRFVFFAWFLGSTIENFLCPDVYQGLYLIFLTNQTFSLQLAYSAVFLVYVCWIAIRQNYIAKNENTDGGFHDGNYHLPIICKLLWVVINILQVVPYAVTFVYWAILFREAKYTKTCEVVDDLLVHAFNSPWMILDSLIIAVPIRFSHFIFPFTAAFLYSLFSGIYELAGGKYAENKTHIYPMLDWKLNPGLAVGTCIGGIIGGFVGHTIFSWGIYKLRMRLKACIKHQADSSNTHLREEVEKIYSADDEVNDKSIFNTSDEISAFEKEQFTES